MENNHENHPKKREISLDLYKYIIEIIENEVNSKREVFKLLDNQIIRNLHEDLSYLNFTILEIMKLQLEAEIINFVLLMK